MESIIFYISSTKIHWMLDFGMRPQSISAKLDIDVRDGVGFRKECVDANRKRIELVAELADLLGKV